MMTSAMKSLFVTVCGCCLAAQLSAAHANDIPSTPQTTANTTSSDSYLSRAQDVVLNAMGFLGIPYRWGGSTPDAGFDCAGLVQYVFKQALGTLLPRTSYDMGVMGLAISTADLLPG